LGAEQLVVLTKAEQTFTLPFAGPDPVVSINRGFTAPVVIERDLAREDLVFLAAHDDDPFARSEALQELAVGHLVGAAGGALSADEQAAGEAAIIGAFRSSLADAALDDAMRGELMMLPSETYLFEAMATGNPCRTRGSEGRYRQRADRRTRRASCPRFGGASRRSGGPRRAQGQDAGAGISCCRRSGRCRRTRCRAV
jgi:aminopeptidase N